MEALMDAIAEADPAKSIARARATSSSGGAVQKRGRQQKGERQQERQVENARVWGTNVSCQACVLVPSSPSASILNVSLGPAENEGLGASLAAGLGRLEGRSCGACSLRSSPPTTS